MAGLRGRAERAACLHLRLHGYHVFAHGPTVLTNRMRYDTKRHFLKIFFVVYSIITTGTMLINYLEENTTGVWCLRVFGTAVKEAGRGERHSPPLRGPSLPSEIVDTVCMFYESDITWKERLCISEKGW